jgi:hypothetical protein
MSNQTRKDIELMTRHVQFDVGLGLVTWRPGDLPTRAELHRRRRAYATSVELLDELRNKREAHELATGGTVGRSSTTTTECSAGGTFRSAGLPGTESRERLVERKSLLGRRTFYDLREAETYARDMARERGGSSVRRASSRTWEVC